MSKDQFYFYIALEIIYSTNYNTKPKMANQIDKEFKSKTIFNITQVEKAC